MDTLGEGLRREEYVGVLEEEELGVLVGGGEREWTEVFDTVEEGEAEARAEGDTMEGVGEFEAE